MHPHGHNHKQTNKQTNMFNCFGIAGPSQSQPVHPRVQPSEESSVSVTFNDFGLQCPAPIQGIPIYSLFDDDSDSLDETTNALLDANDVRDVEFGIPICSLYKDGEDTMTYGNSAATIDWNSWDTFIQMLVSSHLYVKKDGCLYSRRLSFERGFLVMRSLMHRKVVCVRAIKSCVRIGRHVMIDTEEYGFIQLKFSKLEHSVAFSRVISGFVAGLYNLGLE